MILRRQSVVSSIKNLPMLLISTYAEVIVSVSLFTSFITEAFVLISRFKVNMSAFPTISKIHGALCELEAFKQSHPLNQPDCPPELKDKK